MLDKRVSLNMNVRGLRHSATLAIQAKVRRMQDAGEEVCNLGLGQSPFPVPAHVTKALQANAHHKEYLPVEGLPALREAVAGHSHRRSGIQVEADQVLIGPGTKELLFMLQLCFYGEIIVPTPCWVSYTPQSRIVGRRTETIPTRRREGWRLSAEQLEERFEKQEDRYRPRLFVLNYPANPTGVSYSEAELKEIAEVARKYEVLLLSDEIYGGLTFDEDHVSVAKHYPEGTIILDGISKWAGAGGWRLGSFTFPKELRWLQDTMAAVASETYTSVSAPIQYAAIEAYRHSPEMDDYLHHANRILKALGTHCHDRLRSAGIGVATPQGGFYLFPDFRPLQKQMRERGIRTSTDLCEALLSEAGVAMLPGSAFHRDKEELTARMAYVDFDGEAAMAASRKTEGELDRDWLQTHCPRVVDGMERVVDWVQG